MKKYVMIMINVMQRRRQYGHGEKSLKVPFIIYADLECLLEKIITHINNLKKSYTETKAKHTPSGYS